MAKGFRYTMVDFDYKKEVYELYCYENDKCILIEEFESEDDALDKGDRFLNHELETA